MLGGDGRVRTGLAVLVVGDRISRIAPDAELPVLPGDWEVACRGRLVTPGLVDCHAHLVSSQLFPSSGEALLRSPRARFERRLAREEALTAGEVEALTAHAIACALRAGVTMAVEHLACPSDVHGALGAQARTAARLGFRLATAHATHSAGSRSAEAQIEENLAFARARKQDPWVRGLAGFHSASTISRAGLEALARGRDEASGVLFHLAESEDELAEVFSAHGQRVVPYLDGFGLLGETTVAGARAGGRSRRGGPARAEPHLRRAEPQARAPRRAGRRRLRGAAHPPDLARPRQRGRPLARRAAPRGVRPGDALRAGREARRPRRAGRPAAPLRRCPALRSPLLRPRRRDRRGRARGSRRLRSRPRGAAASSSGPTAGSSSRPRRSPGRSSAAGSRCARAASSARTSSSSRARRRRPAGAGSDRRRCAGEGDRPPRAPRPGPGDERLPLGERRGRRAARPHRRSVRRRARRQPLRREVGRGGGRAHRRARARALAPGALLEAAAPRGPGGRDDPEGRARARAARVRPRRARARGEGGRAALPDPPGAGAVRRALPRHAQDPRLGARARAGEVGAQPLRVHLRRSGSRPTPAERRAR